jgi:hypothetical protein
LKKTWKLWGRPKAPKRRAGFRPKVEGLEERLVPAGYTYTWWGSSTTSTDAGSSANWYRATPPGGGFSGTGLGVPGSSDNVIFDSFGGDCDLASSMTFNSLNIDASYIGTISLHGCQLSAGPSGNANNSLLNGNIDLQGGKFIFYGVSTGFDTWGGTNFLDGYGGGSVVVDSNVHVTGSADLNALFEIQGIGVTQVTQGGVSITSPTGYGQTQIDAGGTL